MKKIIYCVFSIFLLCGCKVRPATVLIDGGDEMKIYFKKSNITDNKSLEISGSGNFEYWVRSKFNWVFITDEEYEVGDFLVIQKKNYEKLENGN